MKTNDLRLEDLHWIAGFLEGEGTFCRCGGTINVSVSQVQKEPLERLFNFLGGNIICVTPNNPNRKTYYKWDIFGETAEILIKTVFSLMSPKRKNKISEVLSWYASRPGRNFVKSGRKTCRKGLHQWNDTNTFVDYRGKRTCRLCNRLAQERYRVKKKMLGQVQFN